MPLYEYTCAAGHVVTEYRIVAERGLAALCSCGLAAEKTILTPPRVFSDFEGYESPATGKWIEGRRARLEDLKQSGCRPYEIGEMQEAQRRAKANDAKLDATVDEAVERTLNELI